MTYVVTDECIKCKYTDCVDVCPVDCFYEGKLMLIINPDECIDCGVCVDECPINAIKSDCDGYIEWVERAKDFLSKTPNSWLNITSKKDPLPKADHYKNENNKFEKYMSDDC